jgi:plastocyanin
VDHKVAIKGMKYEPAILTIKKGDTVTWTNDDGMTHTATSPFPVKTPYAWNTGDIEEGDSKSVTFTDVKWQGKYGCIYHRSMQGEIKIT